MTMVLELNGIDVDCVIGDYPEERGKLQRLRVDAALTLDDTAGKSDRLADTVDYAALTARIRSVLAQASCFMIERAARLVWETCREDAKVLRAKVRVEKRGSVAHLESASAVMEG